MKLVKTFLLSFVLLAVFSSCKTKNNSKKNNSENNNSEMTTSETNESDKSMSEMDKSDKNESNKDNSERVQNHPIPRLLITSEIGDISKSSEAYTIKSAKIKGNLLTLDVTFDCGCNPHQFSFVGSDMIAKSLPPIRSTKLVLKKVNGEGAKPCKEKSSQIIDIDIKTMAYQQIPGSEIYLNIAGHTERILYTFN